MKPIATITFFVFAFVAALDSTLAAERLASEKDNASDLEISLNTISGEPLRLLSDPKTEIHLVCFLGTECPLAKLYAPRLNSMAAEFAGEGGASPRVQFVGVASNQQDSQADLIAYVAEHQIAFPIIRDAGNKIADEYHATRTPEVFVVDSEMAIRYRGRIDDQFLPGIARHEPQSEDLKLALSELVSGREVSVAKTQPAGCIIGRVKFPSPANSSDSPESVTFAGAVSRILNRHCVECHRPGEIGPFSLTEYDEVVGWAEMILEVVKEKRMPPWHANPDHGEFSNARFVTDEEKKTLAAWVSAGAPLGDESQLPALPKIPETWRLPQKPDVVLEMRGEPYKVPASGIVEYQYFVVDPGFTEDKWIRETQVVPGNRAVVHHAVIFVRPPDGSQFNGIGWLGAYVPGQRPRKLPPGGARLVRAGSKFVFQMHYTPNGTEQTDLTKLGIVFSDPKKVTHEIITLIGIEQDIEIPPHESSHSFEVNVSHLPPHGDLLSITPHMHVRGKSFTLFAQRDGKRETMLDVPNYDFNWQHTYELVHQRPLASIDSLDFRVVYDNSADNPANPNPNAYVMWGDQTGDEMAIGYFDISLPRDRPSQHRESKPGTQEAEAEVERLVKKVFDQFDANRDRSIERSETPTSLERFGFWKYDYDQNGELSEQEVRSASFHRVHRQ